MRENQQPSLDELAVWAGQIEARLVRAFADLPAPANGIIEGNPRDPEREEVREILEGRDWREVRSEEAYYLSSSLWCLNTEARRYYLPGFMLAALRSAQARRGRAEWCNIAASLVLWISPAMMHAWRLPLIAEPMTAEQTEVILEFIRWTIAATGGAGLAEERAITYWEKWLRRKQAGETTLDQGDV